MRTYNGLGWVAGTVCGMVLALSPAIAGGSVKDDPAPERTFAVSVNLGATTDYVFRGISQSFERPAAQGGLDVSYGIFYAGLWSSGVDFVRPNTPGVADGDAGSEVDFYLGIKPTWGPLTFDLGMIYYAYPGAERVGTTELDYYEGKFGVSGAIQKLTLGGTVFYSPDYFAGTGKVWTLEGYAAYELPGFGGITPTVSGLVGSSMGDAPRFNVDGLGDDSYVYWNAGIAFAVSKLTLDFRYWDTDIGAPSTGFCVQPGLCDERFVATMKVTLP